MKVNIENFRAFKATGLIDIKPINLLVGENSSGKTSFSAALKFIFDIFSEESSASFNSDPFFMGSFKDMAHLRGGAAGRAKEFSFTAQINLPRTTEEEKPQGSNSDRKLQFTLRFTESKAQAALNLLDIRFGSDEITLRFERNSIEISDTAGGVIKLRSLFRPIPSSSVQHLDLWYLHYILQNINVSRKRESSVPTSAQSELEAKVIKISEVIRDAAREVVRVTVASAPVRTEPQRVYQITERETRGVENQAAYELAQLKAFEPREWQEIKQGLEDFGKTTGLFRQIDVKHLNKNKDGPFQIELKVGKQTSNIIDVGYGISQSLPLVFDLLKQKNPSVFFIQQPEVHLHPKAQVELATMICEVTKRRRHVVFIETHSDFIVDRIRSDVRDKDYLEENDVGILFFKREDLQSDISQISVNKKGELLDVSPAYREFFLRERMRSMGVS